MAMAKVGGLRALPRVVNRAPCIGARCYATAPAAIEHLEPEPLLPEQDWSIPPLPSADRRRAINNAKPFSEFLTDTFHRQHDYLRISVTERCNLRCLYCMPEEGIQLSPNKEILTTAEIFYLSALFVNQGVNKIRLTGGEPTVRKDIVPLMQQIGSLRRNGLKELALTTNAISLHRKLDAMVEAGLTGVNISLDTLDPFQFQLLTRRQGFDAVMKSINRVQEMNKLGANVKLKINAVVMRGLNDHQILPFVEKTRDEDIEVRFIEYMPFGGNKWSKNKMLPYSEMLDIIRQKYPGLVRLKDAKNDTSKTYQVPGFMGRVGFITSMTHNFCGTCNRLRITSDGNLKVCLHGNSEVSLRDLLRKDHGGEPMDEAAFEAIRQLELDRRKGSDLRFDGEAGWASKEQQLLDVIGAAVKRKKAKHAGMDDPRKPSVSASASSRLQRAQHFQSMARCGVPLHLLQSTHPSGASVRHSSSKPPVATEETPSSVPAETKGPDGAESHANSGSFFGFQSLRALFAPPEPRRRYSRPGESRTSDEPSIKPTRLHASATNEAQTETQRSPSQPFFRSVPSGDKSTTEDLGVANSAKIHESDGFEDDKVGVNDPSTIGRRRRATADLLLKKYIARHSFPRDVRRSINKNVHFNRLTLANIDPATRRLIPARSTTYNKSRSGPERPWGLDKGTADQNGASLTSHALASIESPEPAPEIQTNEHSAPNDDGRIITSDRVQSPQKSQHLTHVKSSGEAHMVDVGTKPATKRVAIAAASVSFSNPEPLRLISENSNKKGDVLSVARIAGIMAAKRTADLIPLCHPVAISKIDVDVVLRQPTSSERSTGSTQGSGGGVDILVQVQCIGPTGVEMEALVGANGAAMTVFDMCKAVDRRIHIQSLYVPYKSGGNSGLHYHEKWAIRCGTAFFKDRGIEIPDNLMTERKAELKEFTRKRKAKMAEIRRSESDKVTTGPSAQHKAE